MGLWSTQATVKGIMMRAAWHWGRNSSVVNDPPGEPGPLPTWGSVINSTPHPYFMVMWRSVPWVM